jgi:hypothetical protein
MRSLISLIRVLVWFACVLELLIVSDCPVSCCISVEDSRFFPIWWCLILWVVLHCWYVLCVGTFFGSVSLLCFGFPLVLVWCIFSVSIRVRWVSLVVALLYLDALYLKLSHHTYWSATHKGQWYVLMYKLYYCLFNVNPDCENINSLALNA